MADRANDEILQLAEQGNLQALSVYLNRHLIPNGAHVKVKQKEDSLHVLIVVMRESENKELLSSVQQLLTRLHPAHIKRARLYTQVLGQKQSVLRQQFSISAAELNVEGSYSVEQSVLLQPVPVETKIVHPSHPEPILLTPKEAEIVNEEPVLSRELTPTSKHRYSVAEFLSQATSLNELKILHTHPFFTSICPQCRVSFHHILDSTPVYWDCPKCGWQDDLSAALSPEKVRGASAQPSLAESKRLGDYLVEAGLLTNGQIEVALKDQLVTDLKFGEILVRRGWIKEETIEYLMQKVILPERTGLHQNAASYLESSRNLLKALLQEGQFEAAAPVSDSQEFQSPLPSALPEIPPTPPMPKLQRVMPVNTGKLANERETLILPDLDIGEYLKDR